MVEQKGIHSVDLPIKQAADTSAQDARFDAERWAFWAMHVQLLREDEGKYVASSNRKVLDRNVDKCVLAWRLYRQFGYQPIYLQLVQQLHHPYTV